MSGPRPARPDPGEYERPPRRRFIDRGEDHLRLGKLLLIWPVRQAERAPLVDGMTTVLMQRGEDVVTGERYAGLALRVPRRSVCLGVAWRGVRLPNPERWRPRYLLRRLPWPLGRIRPPRAPMGVIMGSERDMP